MTCVECGKPIENPRRAWPQVVGFVNPKGKDSMIGRRDTGSFACEECVTRIRSGLSFGRNKQDALF